MKAAEPKPPFRGSAALHAQPSAFRTRVPLGPARGGSLEYMGPSPGAVAAASSLVSASAGSIPTSGTIAAASTAPASAALPPSIAIPPSPCGVGAPAQPLVPRPVPASVVSNEPR
jgi:hypothetical protein